MSLVGTRPILPDELEQYELHHRARIAIKPGITGMWQVSGRSDITDFEEIVRLDRNTYICFPYATFFSCKRIFIKEEEKSGRLDEEKDENSFGTIFCVLRWNSDCKHIF